MNNYFSREYAFESIYNNRYSPDPRTYQQCSYVTFQRSATKNQLDIIKHLKQVHPSLPIIYEIDDNLIDIPEWNFASSFYKENIENIKSIIGICTGVVCSTEELKKTLLPYNDNINVSVNHLPRFIWGNPQPKIFDEDTKHRKTRIMYAGSHNHFDRDSDRGDFGPELIKFVHKTLDKYQWIFVGGIPHSLRGNESIIHHEWKPVIEYPNFLKELGPDICLAPLEDNIFNRCKSNIKALESVALGVPLIASDVTPYKGLPYTAASDEEFISLIERVADMDQLDRRSIWEQQYDILKDQLFWEDDNHKNLFDYINQHLRLMGKE
ncbi:MAG: hypothetical protein RBT45_05005, partial [Acholeplasmataceae bacterium]|nr:hypothetical protein [Acholeplasmataceae bacterium]